MHPTVRRALAGAVLATGGIALLGGCADSVGQPITSPDSNPASSNPGPSVPGATHPPSTPLPPTGGDRAPLGLEIRYVDAHGRVVLLEPKDFPR